MVTIHDTELKEGLLLGITKARELRRPVLVSEVNKVHSLAPLSFFESGKESFLGERFFWKAPSGDFFLAGLGIAAQISTESAEGRFLFVDRKWKQLVSDSIILNQYASAGIGPLMFGGFSFDPLKPKTSLWSKYPDALFHIPKFMVTVAEGELYLTTNVVCTKHDGYSLFNRIAAERDALLKELGSPHMSGGHSPVKIEEISPGEWKNAVADAVEALKGSGPLKKVVLARELRLYFEERIETGAILEKLLDEQRTSFIFSFESGGDSFIGASPERLIEKRGLTVHSACLAGSIARGISEEEDFKLGEELLSDAKNLAEHRYVVNMIRKAMEETCEQVDIPEHPQLMKLRDIQHLYTPVKGFARQETSLLSLVERLHPTPALGGLPKEQAIEKIREIEALDRGFYASPIGWVDYSGNGEFAVAIRSALVQGKEASLFAGCGVVANSDAESEYLETGLKFRPMLSALGGNKK